ncbi:HAD-IIB family hydrolase [Pseudoprimorskyibacter insulae]|uniref:Glucosyl-3-phosphoglycerate/mannosyl-3-phosphoglycerate phosphatase n=1 Tax=Pseudoprimorskyibacter insulae TaxID=1695997 RepID=A0A2R8AW35_9RHOB|nr:HAD-IIB family hydrolase [Pseudoprimorskyibacter insulae]SPF80238.1 Glucosyl-3-phosphoglycerate/mannosyl-3-phosphoglycerate phosphatase [Pseudoprimorskyibacter insulae]
MRLVVFSDLDGTLLDHDTYSFNAAIMALNALKLKDIPLVLASSKTADEIRVLHGQMGLGAAPMIVENGAGVVWPGQEASAGTDDYSRLRDALAALPADLRAGFRGFGDMTDQGVADVTGLAPEAAAMARKRQHSEPGLWALGPAKEQIFIAVLADQGITARRGGRFLTLSFGRTKADAMAEVAQALKADVTMALGDAPNDTEMLLAADYGVIIRNDHGTPMPPLAGEDSGTVTRTHLTGPAGWNQAVLHRLDNLTRS